MLTALDTIAHDVAPLAERLQDLIARNAVLRLVALQKHLGEVTIFRDLLELFE